MRPAGGGGAARVRVCVRVCASHAMHDDMLRVRAMRGVSGGRLRHARATLRHEAGITRRRVAPLLLHARDAQVRDLRSSIIQS